MIPSQQSVASLSLSGPLAVKHSPTAGSTISHNCVQPRTHLYFYTYSIVSPKHVAILSLIKSIMKGNYIALKAANDVIVDVGASSLKRVLQAQY